MYCGTRHMSKSQGDDRTRLSNSVRQWERFFMGEAKRTTMDGENWNFY
jgi:hypothetical protein